MGRKFLPVRPLLYWLWSLSTRVPVSAQVLLQIQSGRVGAPDVRFQLVPIC